MTTTTEERVHLAKDVDYVPAVSFWSKLALAERRRAIQTRLRRAAPAPMWAATHGWYATVGISRAIRGAWRWIVAAELRIHLDAKPDFVVRERARRRRTAAWTIAIPTVAWSVAAGLYWPWPLYGLFVACGACVVAAAIVEKRRRAVQLDALRTRAGKLPGGKIVRQAFADARLGEIRVVGAIARDDGADAWIATVELPAGTPASKAVARRPELASALGVDLAQLDASPISGHAGRLRVTCFDTDPMAGAPIRTPLAGVDRIDLWNDRVPVGVDTRGRVVDVSLIERSALIGGEPGAGKSVAAMNLLLGAALDPHVELWLGDGKGVDTLDLEPLARRVAPSANPAGLLAIIDDLQTEMDARYKRLRKLARKKVAADLGLPLIVLWIDELARYTTDPEYGKAIIAGLRDVIARGRASGIITLCATQRPSADVVPTSIRDILSIRDALRSTTDKASDTILGAGRASAGYSAATIGAQSRGAGYLLDEGTTPVLIRHFMVSPADEQQVIARARDLREAAGTLVLPADHPRRKALAAVLDAFADAERLSTEELLARVPGGWDAQSLSQTLALDGYPKPLFIDGRTKQGYARGAVLAALDAL